jgi:curved DNA-binding protein CbpA
MDADCYALLQIQPSATSEEIHRAYRALAMRYHPDRNSTPGAASMMAAINEAYSILSEPARRRRYDQQRARGHSAAGVAGPVLRAAYEAMLRHGWTVVENDEQHLVLEQGTRALRITFVPRLDNALLRKIGRQFAGFSVVLAVEIETPINLSFETAVIDLMHSRHHGAPFPDDVYRSLFVNFVL